jgi:hypothetical protein
VIALTWAAPSWIVCIVLFIRCAYIYRNFDQQ